ncbi:L-xylulose reductase-like [Liolophura sinensis]|uniref:L-xylulose reductase-like n=1 Tax=Liolophura sinensis TaxID=3198878 RepID=UPI0031582ECD
MEIRFDGKRALVTGAGKGIGRGLVESLVKCGAETYALSRTQADLESLKAEIPSVHTVQVDLMNWEETRKAVQNIGPVDLLVNNAGINILQNFLDVTTEAYDRIFDINLKAVFNISQIVCKGMIERGVTGSVVNVSSQASMVALPAHAAYCASKGAIDMLTKVMALELGPHKIRVNAVNPTIVMTPLGKMSWSDPAKSGPQLARTPMGKFAEVEDVVNAILFLLSDKAGMIHGSTLPVDGGRLTN